MYDRSLDALRPAQSARRARPLPERAPRRRVRSREPRRGSRAVDRSDELRPEFRRPARSMATTSSSSTATASAGPGGAARAMLAESQTASVSRCGRGRARGACLSQGGVEEESWEAFRARTDELKVAAESRGSQARGRAPRSVAAQQFLRDRLLEAAAADRRGRLGGRSSSRCPTPSRPGTSGSTRSRGTCAAARVRKETRSVKELMVRPVPAALPARRGQAELKVVVNNAGSGRCRAASALDIVDPETSTSALARVRPDRRAGASCPSPSSRAAAPTSPSR